jgi:hypothetical protein
VAAAVVVAAVVAAAAVAAAAPFSPSFNALFKTIGRIPDARP